MASESARKREMMIEKAKKYPSLWLDVQFHFNLSTLDPRSILQTYKRTGGDSLLNYQKINYSYCYFFSAKVMLSH